MGNQQKQGFSPNFNVEDHQRKMNEINHLYSNTNNSHLQGRANPTQIQQHQLSASTISRSSAIYKPTIDIKLATSNGINQCQVSLTYNSSQPATLHIYLGVEKVHQDQWKKTVQIDSAFKQSYHLNPNKKSTFNQTLTLNQHPIHYYQSHGIVLTISNHLERTEYTLTFNNHRKWHAVIEKYEQNGGSVCYLDDVYGGGEGGQECIVCLTDQANTMVIPCKHLCLCSGCSETAKNTLKVCPICRKNIKELVVMGQK